MPSDSTLNHALVALFEHIASSDKPILISYQTANEWHTGTLALFLKHRLISTASSAKSIECSGCEKHCFMDVITRKYESITRAFIMCEDAEMQSQVGRIKVPIEHLKQWKSSHKHLAKVTSKLLKIDSSTQNNSTNKIRLGMMKSSKGRRWVSLQFKPLSLEINQYLIPINELLYFENEELQIDHLRINELLESKEQSKGKSYKPSSDKQEARKLNTKAMYQDWNDEYIKLLKSHPDMSDVWYSKQIAKLEISQGKTSEYIRKNMKN